MVLRPVSGLLCQAGRFYKPLREWKWLCSLDCGSARCCHWHLRCGSGQNSVDVECWLAWYSVCPELTLAVWALLRYTSQEMHVREHQHNCKHYVTVGNYVVYVNSVYVNLVHVNSVYVNLVHVNFMTHNSPREPCCYVGAIRWLYDGLHMIVPAVPC